jgi:hypothetical protein
MNEDLSLSPYEIFEGTSWEAGLLQSILTDNEIASILRDTTILPWNALPSNSGTAKVFVARRDFEKAREVVDEFQKNLQKQDEPDSPNDSH